MDICLFTHTVLASLTTSDSNLVSPCQLTFTSFRFVSLKTEDIVTAYLYFHGLSQNLNDFELPIVSYCDYTKSKYFQIPDTYLFLLEKYCNIFFLICFPFQQIS